MLAWNESVDSVEQPDKVALRIDELTDLDRLHHLVGAHEALACQPLRLGQSGLDVGHPDVEGDVPAVALRARSDSAADPDAIGTLAWGMVP